MLSVIGNPSPVCIHAEQCGWSVVLEHNGDVYAYDHCVYPEYKLGNIVTDSLLDLVAKSMQSGFGIIKGHSLPRQCRECEILAACRGGCPKHRFEKAYNDEPGLHYLCKGYKKFFLHIRKYLNVMTRLLEKELPVSLVMQALKGPLVIKLGQPESRIRQKTRGFSIERENEYEIDETAIFIKDHETKGGYLMKRSGWMWILCCLALLAFLGVGSVWAGGVMMYDFGSPDVGLASAGYAARAQDAATVFTNPAGMSRLEKSQVLGGLQALYGDVEFSPSPATTFSGSDGGNAIGWMPGGSLFVVEKLNQDWSIGFGILSYFGLSEGFDDNWVGRYHVQESTLIGLTLMPAVSYRLNNWLYLGAGLNMMYGYLENKVAINNINESLSDGQLKYDDGRWGYGANLGILVEPAQGTRFGLTYLSEVKLDFNVIPEFSGLGPGLETVLRNQGLLTSSLDLSMTVPQMVMFSAYHELNEKWAVMGNVNWQEWSRFGKVDVQINTSDPRSLTVVSDYNDTWQVALGVQYRYLPEWTFTGGISYDSSAVDDDKRTVTVPMGETWGFALGAQYAVNPNLTLGASYALAWLGDMSVNQPGGPLTGRIVGDFSNSSFNIFALNLKWTY